MSSNVPQHRKGSRKPARTEDEPRPGIPQTSLTAGDLNATGGGVINVAAGDIQYTQIIYQMQASMVGEAEALRLENLPPEPGDPPFLGLQYFDEKDASRFFGREELTARIIGRLHRTRFLAVIGASGSGKSSLVHAGVIPALRKGERLADNSLPPMDSGQWLYRVMTPTAHPMEALAATLAQQNSSLEAIHDLQQSLTKTPSSLSLAVRQLLAGAGQKNLFLVIDQFEEIFTQCRSQDERQALIDALLGATNPQDAAAGHDLDHLARRFLRPGGALRPPARGRLTAPGIHRRHDPRRAPARHRATPGSG